MKTKLAILASLILAVVGCSWFRSKPIQVVVPPPEVTVYQTPVTPQSLGLVEYPLTSRLYWKADGSGVVTDWQPPRTNVRRLWIDFADETPFSAAGSGTVWSVPLEPIPEPTPLWSDWMSDYKRQHQP